MCSSDLFGRTPRARVVRFVVLFPGRTGSTFLMSALRDHDEVRATGELIGPLRTEGWTAQSARIEEWMHRPFLAPEKATGFKTKLVDVGDRDGFRGVLDAEQYRVIVLARDNHVKHVVSRANAKRLKELTDRWNRRPGDDELPPVTIDIAEFDEALARVQEHQDDIEAWAATLSRPVLRVTYEQLLADGQATFDQVCEFLGVGARPLQGRTEKATKDDLRDALENFDELRAHYAGTAFAPMFDEVVAP